MKDWANYLDEKRFVTQHRAMGGDAGDSLNRTAVIRALTYLGSMPWPIDFNTFEVLGDGKGKYRRHWDSNKWYSDFDRTSRDQLTPLLIWYGATSYTHLLREMFKDHLKRALLFAYNTRRNYVYPTEAETIAKNPPDSGVVWNYGWKVPDLTGPEIWALYIRGFQLKLLYPLLYLFDLQTLAGSLALRLKPYDDVINHALILEYGRVRMDTLWMKIARKVTSAAFLQARLDNFFSREIEPPINELYRSITQQTK